MRRKCKVTHPDCAPFLTEAADEQEAIERFKNEWCNMGETTHPFTVEWLQDSEVPAVGAAAAPPRSPAPPEPPAAPVPDEKPAEVPADQPETRLEMLRGLQGSDLIFLHGAGLRTIEAVIQHAKNVGPLSGIQGIDAATEKRIRGAIKTWQQTSNI